MVGVEKGSKGAHDFIGIIDGAAVGRLPIWNPDLDGSAGAEIQKDTLLQLLQQNMASVIDRDCRTVATGRTEVLNPVDAAPKKSLIAPGLVVEIADDLAAVVDPLGSS